MRRAAALLAASIALVAVSTFFGARLISPLDVAAGGAEGAIFTGLRVPRALLAWCAGASLGVCGAICQAVFRNPLADPSLLGVSSGAAFGAALAIRLGAIGVGMVSYVTIPACAFVGAIAASVAIGAFARAARSSRDSTLPLAGVAIGAMFSSAVMALQYTGGEGEIFRLASWMMGGISAVGMADGLSCAPSLLVALSAAALYADELDLMTFGDEIASTRGVDVARTRRLLLAVVSLAVAVVAAKCGPLAFVGLIAPHVARRMAGERHLPLAVASAAIGGALLAVCDALARTLLAPAELPVGMVVSFLGAPFFLRLLFSDARR